MKATIGIGGWLALFLVGSVGAQGVGQVPEELNPYEGVSLFGGPNSVGGQLMGDAAPKEVWFKWTQLDGALEPWFDWKAKLQKDHGVAFGLNYTALGEWASESQGETWAAGGIFEALLSWSAFGREGGDTGTLVFKLENRHRLGSDISPLLLGFEAGSALPTVVKFSDFGWGITNLYWQQKLADQRLSLLMGTLDVTDYTDIYGLINPLTSFTNFAFSTNPTIAIPNQGLGFAAGAMPTERFYALGGLVDANGEATTSGFDTFFEDKEYFSHIELGMTTARDRAYFDNIHIGYWHQDARQGAGVPEGSGVYMSASHWVNDRLVPFLRAGYSDGGAAALQASVSAGLGFTPKPRGDMIGLGINWGQPFGGLRDQYTMEAFYRLQVAQNLAITPDFQAVVNPSLNPTEDVVFFFGLRARVTF